MIGADVGASHGRPEYVIPALDLEGYFSNFFETRRRRLDGLGTIDSSPAQPASQPGDPSTGIEDVDAWACGLASNPALSRERPWKNGLDALQKKFAVFGRIHRSYDGSMRKRSEVEVRPATLCRLARVFFLGFQNDGDWNALNSAVKLVEKAATSAEADAEFRRELATALRLESDILRRLVDG